MLLKWVLIHLMVACFFRAISRESTYLDMIEAKLSKLLPNFPPFQWCLTRYTVHLAMLPHTGILEQEVI